MSTAFIAPPQAISEAALQSQCYLWWRNEYAPKHNLPYQLLYMLNNNSTGARRGSQAKAMGLTPGIPDMHLAIGRKGWHSLYIEFKREGEYVTAVQREVHAALKSEGHSVEIVYGPINFKGVITEYLA